MKLLTLSRFGLLAALASQPAAAAIVTWDAGAGTNAWSTPNNWDPNTEPASGDDVILPLALGSSLTLGTGENAKSLTFDGTYTLTGGGLTLAAGSSISVADGQTATITTPLTATGGTTKTGTGKLILNGANTFSGNLVINAGTARAGSANAIGAAANAVTVNSTGTLEIGTLTLDRAIALNNGSTLQGAGSAVSNGTTTVAAGATVTLGTVNAADSLAIGNAVNDFTGGAGATVITAGPGAVRLMQNSNYTGTWNVPAGTRLDLATATSPGATPASGLTLSGGTLAGRGGLALSFAASQAGAITLTADSTLLSDRSTATIGLTYTFGTLSMGSHTLSVASGANATSGTAAITMGNVTLTGNPVFAINEPGAAAVKLTTGSLLGGGVARSVSKTGTGDLSITGGATALPAGSTFTASGSGSIYEFISPATGAANPLVVTPAENALGEASATITDGTVRLLTNGNSSSTAQTIQLAKNFTLGGTITLDPDRISAGSNKTFELPGLTLAAGSDLTMQGANTSSLRLTSPLTLQGSATLRGSAQTARTGLITAQAGITGGMVGDTLTLNGGTSPLALVLNAPGSFAGSTVISGGTVTANAAPAFGPGAVSVSSGSLTVNTDGAIAGTLSVSGGTLRVNDNDALALNPINLSGGTLDLRSNTSTTFTTGTLTVSGNSTLNVANNGSGASQTITLPTLHVTGAPLFTVTNGNSFTPMLPSIQLGGDLTLSSAITVRSSGIAEDASARKLIKAGGGTLELEAASTHSGGTEILAGVLLAEHSSALGSGDVLLGDTSGSSTVTLRLAAGLTVNNDLTVRAGSSGAATISTLNPSNTTFAGDITLQRGIILDGAGTNPFTFTGRITGPFDVTRTGSGPIVLTNSLNSFGTGGPGALTISAGTVSVGSDAPLGNGGITLTGSSSTLHVTDTFVTSRLITHGANARIEVDAAKIFTLNTALPADVIFDKEGAGTLAFSPTAVSTRTLGADVEGGTLRMTGAQGLSTGGVITMTNGTRLELMNDTNTAYPQSVASISSSGFTIHTDRADGGSATGGTHSIGPIALGTGSLTHMSANGFALTTGAVSTTGSANVSNDAAGLLTLPSLSLGGTTTAARTLTMETNGADIRVTGTLTETGTPIYNLTKRGAHTLRLESGLGLSGAVTLLGGTLDLNNTSNNLGGALTLAGENPASAVLLQSGAGILTLGGNVTLTTSFNPPTATIAGAALDLGGADRTFTVPISSAPGPDLEITSAITGSAGLVKTSSGVLRLSGSTANTFTGLTTITDGTLELGKTGANAIGGGGLQVSGTSVPVATLLADNQIPDTAPVIVDAVTTSAQLNLAGFSETTGVVTIRSADTDGARLTTGATGVLTLNGSLTLENNRDSTIVNAREVLITGSGTEFAPASDGTLDLGGVNRVITTSTTVVSPNAALAHATIETAIINGGIVKRGRQTLFLPNAGNTLAGGVRIEEGCVDFAGTGSPGSGGITFAPGAGVTACFEFSGSGTSAVPIALGGDAAGTSKITYGGAIGESYTLSAPLTLTTGALCVEVTHGTNSQDTAATLNLTGTLSGPNSLTKTGSGILTLAPGNTHTGTTVQRGVLKVTADSALGDSTGTLTVNGGCFHADGTFALTRPFVFGANGGCIRVDRPDDLLPKNALTIPALTWSDAAQSFFSSGQAILSGTTTAGAGPLTIGAQTVFADATPSTSSFNSFVLSLRGASVLPAGNLSLVNRGVLELGTGNLTRALGTAAGEVQMPTNFGAGFAAHGADRLVNFGGAAAQIVWGSHDPAGPFLGLTTSTSGGAGRLILGSETATHTVEFQNPLEVRNNTTSTFFSRTIEVPDGPAAVEARISGDITLTHPDPGAGYGLNFEVHGALEVTGDIQGNVDAGQYSPGTTTLSGTNSLNGFMDISGGGKLVLTSNAAAGSPRGIWIDEGSELDLSALATPMVQISDNYCDVAGTLRGSLTTGGFVSGNGTVTGNLIMTSSLSGVDGIEPFSDIFPLRIGGNFSLNAGTTYWAWANGTAPGFEHSQISVTGTVTLGGTLNADFDPFVPPSEGDTYYIILNAGSDAVSGTFDGLPEGALIEMANGQTGFITYIANGDGGPVGNDVAIIAGPAVPPPSGEVTIVSFTQNIATCQVSMTVATEQGQDYLFEVSEDLVNWSTVESWTGDGTNHTVTSPLPVPGRQFLRVSKDDGGGGGVGE